MYHNHHKKLNHHVKNREWFRPYAPVILEDKKSDYFEDDFVSPYMMKINSVKKTKIKDFLSGIHVDNSARFQTINKNQNLKFYRLIQEIDKITNIPIVLNTSLNLSGMPIVETPYDALKCFEKANGVNHLFINNYYITRAK